MLFLTKALLQQRYAVRLYPHHRNLSSRTKNRRWQKSIRSSCNNGLLKATSMKNLTDTDGLDQIRRDMEHFCHAIGNRRPGTKEEEQAADYTASRFQELGMENVETLPFACKQWVPGNGSLEVLLPSQDEVACYPVANSPATPEEGIEGELVSFEPVDWVDGLRHSELAGKIGLFHGGYGESADAFRELHESPLAALVFVDNRTNTDWLMANGMGEKFQKICQKPMAYMSLMDAWALAKDGAKRVRLTCSGKSVDSESHNVVGELPGSDPDGKVVVVCGHLDSVALGCGADDDASGMAAIFETARRLKNSPRKSTLRFIGFGAEEQLSIGSVRYVNEQVDDPDRIYFVCNYDSIGAVAGSSQASTTGTTQLDDYAREIIEKNLCFGLVKPDVSPYQDGYPFAAQGIPGIWFTRYTHAGGYWYLHSEHDLLENCSIDQIAWTAEAGCEVLGKLLNSNSWPFPREISPTMQEKIDKYQRELFC